MQKEKYIQPHLPSQGGSNVYLLAFSSGTEAGGSLRHRVMKDWSPVGPTAERQGQDTAIPSVFKLGGGGRRDDTSRRWVLSQGLRPGGSGSPLGWGILRRMALGVKAGLWREGPARDSPMLHQGSLWGHQARYEDICGCYDWGCSWLQVGGSQNAPATGLHHRAPPRTF